jgi:hypothetical protein
MSVPLASREPFVRAEHHHVPVTRHDIRDYRITETPRPSLGRFVGEVPVSDLWLELRVAPDWIGAYRLKPRVGREPAIVEVRLLPFEENRLGVGRWSAEYLGWRAKGPRRPLTAAQWRSAAPDGPLVGKALSACAPVLTEKQRQIGFLGVEIPDSGTSTGPRRGRPARSDVHYAKIACRYDELESGSVSTDRRDVRGMLAEEYGVPVTTIAEWLRTARRLGFLTTNGQGRRHSEATAPARMKAEANGWQSGQPVRTARTR